MELYGKMNALNVPLDSSDLMCHSDEHSVEYKIAVYTLDNICIISGFSFISFVRVFLVVFFWLCLIHDRLNAGL